MRSINNLKEYRWNCYLQQEWIYSGNQHLMKITSQIINAKKRKYLACYMEQKIQNPIGYSCPALLRPKIMLQNAWKKNISWNCELPTLWKDQFQRWCNEVHFLKEIKIPRICNITNSTCQELHHSLMLVRMLRCCSIFENKQRRPCRSISTS